MFGLFESPRFHDPRLGELRRSRGKWRGALTLEGNVDVPLALCGSRTKPDAEALAIAADLAKNLVDWRPSIEQSLLEHYRPYGESLAAGELPAPDEPLPVIATPEQVWPHVTLVFVAVTPLDGALTVELGYETRWDEEHTLGARLRSGELIELCGSVLPP